MPGRLAKTKRGSGRAGAKNGAAQPGHGGNRVHRVDLQAEELEVLVKACQNYRASLPCYLASVQDDVARTQALIGKLGDLIGKRAD